QSTPHDATPAPQASLVSSSPTKDNPSTWAAPNATSPDGNASPSPSETAAAASPAAHTHHDSAKPTTSDIGTETKDALTPPTASCFADTTTSSPTTTDGKLS